MRKSGNNKFILTDELYSSETYSSPFEISEKIEALLSKERGRKDLFLFLGETTLIASRIEREAYALALRGEIDEDIFNKGRQSLQRYRESDPNHILKYRSIRDFNMNLNEITTRLKSGPLSPFPTEFFPSPLISVQDLRNNQNCVNIYPLNEALIECLEAYHNTP